MTLKDIEIELRGYVDVHYQALSADFIDDLCDIADRLQKKCEELITEEER